MNERTNLAEILAHVFLKLEQNIPTTDQNAPTLLEVWNTVLGGPGRTPLDIIASIGQLSSIMIKLELQIEQSRKLNGSQIRSAHHCVDQFKIFFMPEKFHINSFVFRTNCSELNRGTLGLVGSSLESEFSEPKLEKHDAESLIEELKSIVNLIDDSILEINLKINLKKHLTTMIWWLSNPEYASLQDIFETSGSAILISKQILDQDKSNSADKKKEDIFNKLFVYVNRVGKLVGLAKRGADDINQITTDVHHMLSNISTSI